MSLAPFQTSQRPHCPPGQLAKPAALPHLSLPRYAPLHPWACSCHEHLKVFSLTWNQPLSRWVKPPTTLRNFLEALGMLSTTLLPEKIGLGKGLLISAWMHACKWGGVVVGWGAPRGLQVRHFPPISWFVLPVPAGHEPQSPTSSPHLAGKSWEELQEPRLHFALRLSALWDKERDCHLLIDAPPAFLCGLQTGQQRW